MPQGGNAPWLNIAGGTWVFKAGGDGIDSNGTAFISGGNVTVWGPNNGGNGSLDAERGLVVSGGTLFTAGAAGMAQGPNTSSSQASIMVTGSASAGSVMAILDSSGKEIASYTLEVNGQSFIFSSSEIVSGQSYTVTVDGKTVVTAVGGQYNAGGMGGGPMGGGGRP